MIGLVCVMKVRRWYRFKRTAKGSGIGGGRIEVWFEAVKGPSLFTQIPRFSLDRVEPLEG